MSQGTADTTEILLLYARYNTAIDTGDSPTFSSCFTPDGLFLNAGRTFEGREQIAEFARRTHEAMPGLRHETTNILVDLDGDVAAGSAFLTGYTVGEAGQVIATGRYRDELARTDGMWLFSRRLFEKDE